MMNECIHKLQNNIPTLYIDTEMSDRNFTERLIANLSGIPIYKIKSGNYGSSDEIIINEAKDFIKSSKLVHIYDPFWTNDKVYTTCKILQYKMDLQFVIYDYLKSNATDSSGQYNDLGNKTNFLKNDIAGGLQISVLAGAQLNRGNEIADSYKIEQYASTILNLRPKSGEEIMQDGKECGNYALSVKLNRNGEQQDIDSGEYIDLLFKGNVAIMEQAQKQHEIVEPF
jgi:replicative DNA helicase